MDTPVERLLTLLSLLQARPRWTADELAERLGTTTRTVRRSVARLRDLGYPVDAEPGPAGGYTLGAGAALPPLLLSDEEAAAVAIGLHVAAGHGLSGFEDAAVAALAKLAQVMPARVRERVAAVQAMTVPIAVPGGPPIAPDTLVALARGCRSLERVRFTYVDSGGRSTERHVEPYQLVHAERRWYLVANDPARGAWRTFRLDRMRSVELTGHRFVRARPEPDARALVADGMALHAHDVHALVELAVSPRVAAEVIPRTVGVLEPAGPADRTRLRIGGDLDWLARYLIGLPFAFTVIEPADLRTELTALGARLQRDHA